MKFINFIFPLFAVGYADLVNWNRQVHSRPSRFGRYRKYRSMIGTDGDGLDYTSRRFENRRRVPLETFRHRLSRYTRSSYCRDFLIESFLRRARSRNQDSKIVDSKEDQSKKVESKKTASKKKTESWNYSWKKKKSVLMSQIVPQQHSDKSQSDCLTLQSIFFCRLSEFFPRNLRKSA